ncbi:MAG: hypothetical protein AB7F50_11020 [Fimbriimonadaceae bacterium]
MVARRATWPEFLLALATAVMIGHNLSLARTADQSQSAMFFYWQNPWVGPMNLGSTLLCGAVCLGVAAWIGMPGRGRLFGPLLLVFCCIGAAGAWSEAVLAARAEASAGYVLAGLPILPLSSYGLVGSQAFLTYILSSVVRRGGARPPFGLVLLWSVGLLCTQWLAWDGVLRTTQP